MLSSGMLCCVALVRTDISDKHSTSIFRVTRIGALGMLAVTSNRNMLRRNVPIRAIWCDNPKDSILLCSLCLHFILLRHPIEEWTSPDITWSSHFEQTALLIWSYPHITAVSGCTFTFRQGSFIKITQKN
jgi:hypothetical protein